MKYIWGFNHENFSYMCPYFWLSIFNVIISPIFLPLKFLFCTVIVFICKHIYRFFQFIGRVLEDWYRVIERKVEEDALKREEIRKIKWKKQLMTMDEVAISRLKEANFTDSSIKMAGEYGHVNYLYNYIPAKKERDKKWMKWFRTFIALHYEEPEAFKKILAKTREVVEKTADALESLPKLRSEVLDSNEEKERKLQLQIAKQEQEEMRENAKKLAEAEKQRLLLIRKNYKQLQIIKNKQRINKILRIAKPIATAFIWIIGIITGIIGLYLLYLGILALNTGISNIPHKFYVDTGVVFKWIFLGAAGIAVLIGLAIVLGKLSKMIKLPSIPKIRINLSKIGIKIPKVNIPLNRILFKPIVKILSYIWKIIVKGCKGIIYPFIVIFKAIRSFFQTLIQTIKNECPPITWKD